MTKREVATQHIRHGGEGYFWVGAPLCTPLGCGLFATTIEVAADVPPSVAEVEVPGLPDYFSVRALDTDFAARLLGSLRAPLVACSGRERDVVVRDHQVELWCAGEVGALAEEIAVGKAIELAETIDEGAERLGYATWRRRLHERWARHAERRGLTFDGASLTLSGVLHTASGYRGRRERHVEATASLDLVSGVPRVVVVARLSAPAAEDAPLGEGDALYEKLPAGAEVVVSEGEVRVCFVGGDDIASQLESVATIAAALDPGGDVASSSHAGPAAPTATPPKNEPGGLVVSRRVKQYLMVTGIAVGGYYAYSFTYDAVFEGTWRAREGQVSPRPPVHPDASPTKVAPTTTVVAPPSAEVRSCDDLCAAIEVCVGSMPETCRAGCADMTTGCRSCLDAIVGCRFGTCDDACGYADELSAGEDL